MLEIFICGKIVIKKHFPFLCVLISCYQSSNFAPCERKERIQIHYCPREVQSNYMHLQNFHCLCQRKIQSEEVLFPRQMYLLFDQNYIHLLFLQLFFFHLIHDHLYSHLVKFHQPL